MSEVPTYRLNDGAELPAIGFGTVSLRGEEGTAAMTSALEAGYRLLDTAVNYENEREVGEAVRRSGIPRDDVKVCSKIPGRHHGYDDAIRSTHESLERLGLARLDLHLIHWPNPSVDRYVEAWQALVDLQREGLVTSIGVSNFTEANLQRIVDESGVTPAVNQIELHPYFPQAEMRAVDDDRGIRHRVVEPAGQAAGAVHRAAGRRRRGEPRRGPGPGDPAVAGPARRPPDPQVRDAGAAAEQPGRLRVRALRRGDGRDHRRSVDPTAACSVATP